MEKNGGRPVFNNLPRSDVILARRMTHYTQQNQYQLELGDE